MCKNVFLLYKEQIKTMQILEERKVYIKVLEVIEEKRTEDKEKPEEQRTFWSLPNYLLFPKIGHSSQVAYEVERFARGEQLAGRKSRPLHKDKLAKLCKSVGMDILSTYYGIK